MSKDIIYGSEARARLKRGVDKAADVIKATLGAGGRNVAISRPYSLPHITKDGVSVARNIELADPVENVGAQMVIEASEKTAADAGDGTTTAAVLAQAIYSESFKNVAAGANPMEIKKGIDKGVKAVISFLENRKKNIHTKEDYAKVATISANGDEEIGNTVANLIDRVGENGVVTIEDGTELGLVDKYIEGILLDKGYLTSHFAYNEPNGEIVLNNPVVLLVNKKISSQVELATVLDLIIGSLNVRDILIVAEDVQGEALALLATNKIKGNVRAIPVKAPMFGERRTQILEDLAAATGGTLFGDGGATVGLKDARENLFGRASKVIITQFNTTIIPAESSSNTVKQRVDFLKQQLDKAQTDYDKDFLQSRIGTLTTNIAILQVAAATEVEQRELKDRIDDALQATRAAVAEGIVVGGGVALIQAALALQEEIDKAEGDQAIGLKILKNALYAPFDQIMLNAGLQPASYYRDLHGNNGFDVRSEQIVDMLKSGIIDPFRVTKSALVNAASVAVTLMTSEAVIVDTTKVTEDVTVED